MSRRRVLPFAAVTVAAVVTAGVPAAAVTQSGTVSVPRTTSSQGQYYAPVSADGGNVVVQQIDEWHSERLDPPTYLRQADGQLLDLGAVFTTRVRPAVRGTRVYGTTYAGNDTFTVQWFDTADLSTHSCAQELAPDSYDAAGWTTSAMDYSANTLTLTRTVAADSGCTTSAVATWTSLGDGRALASNADGVVVRGETTTGTPKLRYYPFATPGSPVSLKLGTSSYSPYRAVVTSTSVVWTDYEKVFRAPLDGGAPVEVASPDASDLSATNARTGWLNDAGKLVTVPAAGGSTTTSTATYQALTADADSFYVGKQTSSGGSLLAGPKGSELSTLESLGHPTETQRSVALQAGRLFYSSNRGTPGSYSVYKRTVSKSTSGITVGAESLVTSSASAFSLSVSGQRLAFGRSNTTSRFATYVKTGSGSASLLTKDRGLLQLSGRRGLYNTRTPDFSYATDVIDFPTGSVTHLGSTVGSAALFGDRVAYAKYDGSVSLKDLVSGKVTSLRGAGSDVSGVALWGKWVAWAHGKTLSVRDTSAGTTTSVTLPYSGASLRAAAGHVALVYSDRLYTLRWGSTTPKLVTDQLLPDFNDVNVAIDDELVAWVDRTHRVRVTPLATFTSRPRALGRPVVEASFSPNGDGTDDTWSFEAPLTKKLPTCKVAIYKGPPSSAACPAQAQLGPWS